MTLAEFISARGLGFVVWPLAPELFRCRITYEERGMTFFHISATAGDEKSPTLEEVLTRLAAAAHQHECTKLDTGLAANRDVASFKNWAFLYGIVPVEENRQKYLTIRRRAMQLKYVLGVEAYKQFLEIT